MIEGHEITSAAGAVAAEPEEAARVGARILEAGGNAMDAAAAACIASCMLSPARTGIGGYCGSAVVLDGKSGRVWSLDGNGTAPAAAHEKMFEVFPAAQDAQDLNALEYSCQVKHDANVIGPLSIGPVGLMASVGTLWENWGVLDWEEICAPSQRLLEEGFPYGETARQIKRMEAAIRKFEPTRQHLMPEGKIPHQEDIWHRPDMDQTLARLASAGWRDFYQGEIGQRIADYVQSMGGILSREDMARYQVRLTDPYTISYRGAQVYAPILTNGNLSVLQILNMLGCFPALADDSVEFWHRLAEVLKLAWRDRLRYLADPDFVEVPIERLLSKDYAAGRVETIRQFPDHVDQFRPLESGDSGHGTIHISTADAQGNVVTLTHSHGMSFGSCVTVPGTGIILGHAMCRLDPRPGQANSIAPGKRPLNNCGAVLIRLPDRDVGTGLPGGRRIVSVGAQSALRMVDFESSGYEAALAPRLHVEVQEPIEVTNSLDDTIIKGLRTLGHEIKQVGGIGGHVHCAEYLKRKGKVRAGGGCWAAGAAVE